MKRGRLLYRRFRKSIRFLLGAGMIAGAFYGSVYADGLPGEFLLSDQWHTFFKYFSPITNPALMMEQVYTSIRGVGSVSPDEASKLWEVGATVPLGLYNSVGLTIVGENGRNVTGFADESFRDSTTVSNNNFLFMASFASNPIGRLCVGVNINGAFQENFGDNPSFGLGIDLGVSYRLLYHPLFGFHLVGFTFQNVVAPSLNLNEKMPHSSQIKGLYHAAFLHNKLELDLQCMLPISCQRPNPISKKRRLSGICLYRLDSGRFPILR